MGTIAVVLPEANRWFLNEIGRGAQERAVLSGHAAVISRIPLGDRVAERAGSAIEEVFAAEDGLGAVAAGFPYQGRGGERMLAWRKPMVIVGGSVMGFPVVSFDDVGIGRASTEHLLDLGHRRIVHVTGGLAPDNGFVFLRRRARGYRMVMEGAGLTPELLEGALGDPEYETAIEALLTSPNRPTAVFAGYDEIAFVVIEVAKRLGLQIGGDLSVIGVNGHPDAEHLGLTTTRFQPLEVGAAAVQLILDGLEPGVGHARSHLHAGSFIRRASTGRPRTT